MEFQMIVKIVVQFTPRVISNFITLEVRDNNLILFKSYCDDFDFEADWLIYFLYYLSTTFRQQNGMENLSVD